VLTVWYADGLPCSIVIKNLQAALAAATICRWQATPDVKKVVKVPLQPNCRSAPAEAGAKVGQHGPRVKNGRL
jgi:hypothetical protein